MKFMTDAAELVLVFVVTMFLTTGACASRKVTCGGEPEAHVEAGKSGSR